MAIVANNEKSRCVTSEKNRAIYTTRIPPSIWWSIHHLNSNIKNGFSLQTRPTRFCGCLDIVFFVCHHWLWKTVLVWMKKKLNTPYITWNIDLEILTKDSFFTIPLPFIMAFLIRHIIGCFESLRAKFLQSGWEKLVRIMWVSSSQIWTLTHYFKSIGDIFTYVLSPHKNRQILFVELELLLCAERHC